MLNKRLLKTFMSVSRYLSENLYIVFNEKINNYIISARFRWILFFKRELEYPIKKKPHPFPSIIQIQTINACNASCKMCPYATNPPKETKRMSDELFEKIIKEIVKESKSTFIFLYLQNEPLMDNDIFKKIKLIKRLSEETISTGLFTNGSLFTDKKIKELISSGNNVLIVSLDAFTQKTFNKIRKGLNFNHIVANVNKIKNSKYSKTLAVEFTVQKDNIKEFKQFIRFWKKQHVPVVVNYISNRSGDLKDFDEMSIPLSNIPFFRRWGVKVYKKIIKCCPAVLSTFNILSNGDVILCCNDYSKKLILGNVNTSSIKEIWNGPKYQKIREMFYNGEYRKIPTCRYCYNWENNFI